MQIPAAKRFVSYEPLLNEIDLIKDSECNYPNEMRKLGIGIDWCIVGGETGPHARPLHPDWVRSLRDQCQAAGVPFFFKGWGEWGLHNDHFGAGLFLKPDGTLGCQGDSWDGNAQAIRKIGKKKAGRLLDGKIWSEMP